MGNVDAEEPLLAWKLCAGPATVGAFGGAPYVVGTFCVFEPWWLATNSTGCIEAVPGRGGKACRRGVCDRAGGVRFSEGDCRLVNAPCDRAGVRDRSRTGVADRCGVAER